MRRLGKVKIQWSSYFAYAIGLIASDGNLAKDGRHIDLTSKDEAMIMTFKKCLGIRNRIGRKARGNSNVKKYFRVQFGDKNFYEFLLSLGLTPAKSKSIGPLNIPNKYFSDFLRGCIDGDGNISIVRHPESRHQQLRVRLFSASPVFLDWIRSRISYYLNINGGWLERGKCYILAYGKDDATKILNFIYYSKSNCCLLRKYLIAKAFLRV